MENYDIVIIGGGPAGLAAAVAAKRNGGDSILILERDKELGGILNQCIHNGFGLHTFKEELTGPEYAQRFIDQAKELDIEYRLNTMVMDISREKVVTAMNRENGLFEIRAKAVILAMGCRERSRGALNIPGYRPAGIYSAGTAQKYVNVKGYMPGKEVVILGSGDIGLIMARRMTLEGAKVRAVCEIMPHSSGLRRNIAQCLDDFGIPLYLNHTITKIEGEKRVTGVVVSEVDENRQLVPGTEMHFDCDTVLFSVGLIPENELTKSAGIPLSPGTRGAVVYENRETDAPGIFACGNVLQVHDLVDFVSEEAEIAGGAAADFALGKGVEHGDAVGCRNGQDVTYVLPQRIDRRPGNSVKVFFRVAREMRNCRAVAESGGKVLAERRRRIVVPGEMETLLIPEEKLAEADGEIVVRIAED